MIENTKKLDVYNINKKFLSNYHTENITDTTEKGLILSRIAFFCTAVRDLESWSIHPVSPIIAAKINPRFPNPTRISSFLLG